MNSINNINELPEDIFFILFGKYIPLDELVGLRPVCHLWDDIVIKTCQRKKSLKLFGSLDHVSSHAHDLLFLDLADDPNLKLKSGTTADELIGTALAGSELSLLFPAVSTLLYYRSEYSLKDALESCQNLSTLYLNLDKYSLDDEANFDDLLVNLESLSALKNLHLFGVCHSEHYQAEAASSVLSQLEEFSMYRCGCRYTDACTTTFKLLGPNLKKLVLKNLALRYASFANMVNMHSEWTSSVTHLTIDSIIGLYPIMGDLEERIDEETKLFQFICEKFSSLQYLDFSFSSDFTFDEILFDLNKLANLTEVRFKNLWNMKADLGGTAMDSVKTLHLIYNDAYEQFPIGFEYLCLIPNLFPNLEKLYIECTEENLFTANYYLSKAELVNCTINRKVLPDPDDYNNDSHLKLMGKHAEEYENQRKARVQESENFLQYCENLKVVAREFTLEYIENNPDLFMDRYESDYED